MCQSLHIFLYVYLYVYLSTCLSVYLYIYVYVCIYIYLSVYLSVCLSICLNIYLCHSISLVTSSLVGWSVCILVQNKVHRTQGQNTALWDFLGHTNPRPPSPTHPVPLTLCSRSRGFLILLIAQDRATTRTNLFLMSFNFYFRLCKKCYETALFLFLAKFKIIRKFCHKELCRGIPTPPPLCGSL